MMRGALADDWRAAFDSVYRNKSKNTPNQRLSLTFNLLLAFFSARLPNDIRRVLLFARDSHTADLEALVPANAHPSRLWRLMHILVKSLGPVTRGRCV